MARKKLNSSGTVGSEGRTTVPPTPFPVCDRGAFIRKAFVACDIVSVPTFECLTYSIAYDRVEMMHIPVSEMGIDHEGKRTQFYVDGNHVMGGPAHLSKTHLQWLRLKALESGATPDAIRLLSNTTGKFSQKEMNDMAEKLASKAAPKKADAKGLKKAAASTPVGGKKGRGNTEALKKAREAKGPDTRKIKANIKVKDIAAREGSYRHKMVTALLGSKTVQEFRDQGFTAGDLRYAIDADIVSVA